MTGTKAPTRNLRICRAVQVVCLATNLALIPVDVLDGHYGVLALNAFVCAFILALIASVTALIRHREAQARELVRPDYSLIAAMEREVYGREFTHDGAPETRWKNPALVEPESAGGPS